MENTPIDRSSSLFEGSLEVDYCLFLLAYLHAEKKVINTPDRLFNLGSQKRQINNSSVIEKLDFGQGWIDLELYESALLVSPENRALTFFLDSKLFFLNPRVL